MNTLFTSANSPKVMGLHKPDSEESDVSQVSLGFVRRPKMREAESTEKVNVTFLKTSMEIVAFFCHRYRAANPRLDDAVPWSLSSSLKRQH